MSIMKSEDNFTKDCNPLLSKERVKLWKARDIKGSEIEVGEFLYGLVRFLKPRIVLETGCYKGDTSIAIAKALKKNGTGMLHTCDINEELAKFTKNRLNKEVAGYGEMHYTYGTELIERFKEKIDLAFVDSGYGYGEREEEINLLIKYLHPGKIIAIHDTAPQHLGIYKVANKLDLPKLYFNTPRGFTLIQLPAHNG